MSLNSSLDPSLLSFLWPVMTYTSQMDNSTNRVACRFELKMWNLWERWKRSPSGFSAHFLFVDESNFSLIVAANDWLSILWTHRFIMIEITCNDRLGKKIRVKCNPSDTIGDLKRLIAAQTGTRHDKLMLKKWYVIYKDHITLEDYEIKDGMNLELYYQ